MQVNTIFIVFLSTFLSLYCLVNFYIFSRIWHVIPPFFIVRLVFAALFIFLSFSFIGGRVLERFKICTVSDFSIWTGSLWLAYMLYLFMGLALCDLARVVMHFLPLDPDPSGVEWFRRISVVAILVISSMLVLAGHINALSPRVRSLDISVDKKPGIERLYIVMVSDIHCGTLIGNSRLEHMVEMINGLKPDIVLLAGDIVDEDLRPVIEQNIGATLRNIRAADGVFAITGNHEYIGGVENAVAYLEKHGIRVLRDRRVLINGNYYIIGREDRSMGRFMNKRRKKLDALLEGVDPKLPVILMDHQPYNLEDTANHKIDLQLSGHTHHGQLWPLNFITKKIYEISWGYKIIENTHFYVSCGFGTWGPPVRLGNRPEIVKIQIKFR